MTPVRAHLAPLFLVSLVAVAFEIFLTRYFAIANWSEYGYWVISITMVGFATSGVVLSLFNDFFARQWRILLFALPLALILCAAGGFYLTTINPFNPLEFQNPYLWFGQLKNIWLYYAVLFPFFFLAGMYIGLYFLTFQEDIPRAYGADLAGAGAGALLILIAMIWIQPFYLMAVFLPLLVIAATYYLPPSLRGRPVLFILLALTTLGAGETVFIAFNRADFNEYKAIYPPLHVQGNKVAREIRSPSGYFLVLDNFTERLDTDLSNNAANLGVSGPPLTYGLYNDGNRITSLPKSKNYDHSYVKATLDVLPYELKPNARTLLIGTRGGFRINEVLDLGAGNVEALEPDKTLYELIRSNTQDALKDKRVRLSQESQTMRLAGSDARFDIIDIASDFLGQRDANKYAFTLEAIKGYYGALSDDGIVSLPISIRELTVYAVKVIETARRALLAAGVEKPEQHIIVYRSGWNARILITRKPVTPAQIEQLKRFCETRSFDTSFYPGIDPDKVQIWNDLPVVSFESETMRQDHDRASDALMEQTLDLFSHTDPEYARSGFFNLQASSEDRPFFYSILQAHNLKQILNKIALIPREEIGYLINLAVLLQAVVFAVVVLGLPLVRWRRERPRTGVILEAILYFAGLGLGFLFLEIVLIEKMAFFFSDRTYAFAVVLSAMLVFSGLGSFYSGRYLHQPKRGLTLAIIIIVAWLALAIPLLDDLLAQLINIPFALKLVLATVLVAPLSFALGFPFPLGLYLFHGERSHFLPWAWSLNGAFSVISTPLASLLAIDVGFRIVLILSLLLYIMVYLTFPVAKNKDILA